MRILLYGLNYAPELIGIGKYSGELGSFLANQGHDVRAVMAPPYYPHWALPAGAPRFGFRNETLDAVRVLRCPLYIPASPTGLTRILHLASYAATSFVPALLQARWKPDIVFNVIPTLFTAPAALLTARLAGAAAWIHLQDLEVEAAEQLGLIPRNAVARFAGSIERRLLSSFDVVSTISEAMADRLAKRGVDTGKIRLFPNWVDTGRIAPLDRPSELRAELGLAPDDCVVLYSGNLGRKQGLDIIVRAAERLAQTPGLRFVICGGGPRRAQLAELARDIPSVSFLPLQPAERMNELLGLADIQLVPQSTAVADLVFPSKLLGILASGRPVVVTSLPESQLARTVRDCGLCVAPGDIEGFAAAIARLARDAELRRRLGAEARRIATSDFDKQAVLRRFEDACLGLVAERRRR